MSFAFFRVFYIIRTNTLKITLHRFFCFFFLFMKIPLSWISMYADIWALQEKEGSKKLAHLYSIHTAEIEAIEEYFIDKVVIGKVISCEKHPDSTKLSIVQVSIWEGEPVVILTGAANIVNATYVPVALVWAILPGDFTITPRKMAGMESSGMICSIDELGLSNERAEGILILEEIWEKDLLESMVGKSFFHLPIMIPWLHGKRFQTPLQDTVFEIDNKFITNRPDLFSVHGNAREFHAIFDVPFTPYSTFEKICCPNTLNTQILTDKVLSYHLMTFEDITVWDSPFWIQIMMHRAGLSPKFDIVDITNVIMTELGQPMHAFDTDKIEGDIIVRMAREWETLLALNDISYTLSSSDVVIADEKKVLAIAGIIGGMESAVSRETTRISFESACFDPVSVRLTAQRLWIRTDASTRYEKSLDPLLANIACTRVIEYMKFLGKKTQLSGASSYLAPNATKDITIQATYEFINWKTGVVIPKKSVWLILKRLGFWYNDMNESFEVTVPSWRATKDVNIKEDIAEEIGRIYGYEQVPHIPPVGDFTIARNNTDITLRNKTNAYFSNHWWHEVYNYSFSNEDLDTRIGFSDTENAIRIQNAFNVEYTHMRRSMAVRLLENIRENIRHADSFGFFEIGKIFQKEEVKFHEKKMLAGIVVGSNLNSLRKLLEWYLRWVTGNSYIHIEQGNAGNGLFHPGASGTYIINDTSIGKFWHLHPSVLESFNIPESSLYFEIEYETLLWFFQEKEVVFSPISRFQSIPRDLNFILPSHTPTGHIARSIDAIHPWIHDVQVVDTYEDDSKIGKWKKSITFAFVLQNHDGTISDNEAMEIQNTIIDTMKQDGYELRSV